MHQIRFRLRLRSSPHCATGGAYSALQTPSLDFRGPTSTGSEERERVKKGKEGEGTKSGREGKGGRPLPPPSQFATPLCQASPSQRPGLWVT